MILIFSLNIIYYGKNKRNVHTMVNEKNKKLTVDLCGEYPFKFNDDWESDEAIFRRGSLKTI